MSHGANPDIEDSSGKSARDLDPKFFTKHDKKEDNSYNATVQEIPGQNSSSKNPSRRSSMESCWSVLGPRVPRGHPDWMDKYTDQPIPKLANPYPWKPAQKANGIYSGGSGPKSVGPDKSADTTDDVNILCDEELDAILNDIDVAQLNIHSNDRRVSLTKQSNHALQGKVSKEITKLKAEMDDVTKLLEEFSNEEFDL